MRALHRGEFATSKENFELFAVFERLCRYALVDLALVERVRTKEAFDALAGLIASPNYLASREEWVGGDSQKPPHVPGFLLENYMSEQAGLL
jgi:hypothetical protein